MRRLVLLAFPLALSACGGSVQYAAGPRVSVKIEQPSDAKTVRTPSLKLQLTGGNLLDLNVDYVGRSGVADMRDGLPGIRRRRPRAA